MFDIKFYELHKSCFNKCMLMDIYELSIGQELFRDKSTESPQSTKKVTAQQATLIIWASTSSFSIIILTKLI